MKIIASTCKVQGEKVAIVAVQKEVMAGSEAERYVGHLAPVFPDAQVVLFAEDEGKARFYGRSDLVESLGQLDVAEIPWQEIDLDL
jgi:hypothetical protein